MKLFQARLSQLSGPLQIKDLSLQRYKSAVASLIYF